MRKKNKRLEQVEQVESEEELEEDGADLDYEPEVEMALKRRARRAEERATAAEEERKAAEERTKLLEKQLMDMQAMISVLQQQMQMQSNFSSNLRASSSLPPSSPPVPFTPGALSSSQEGLSTTRAVTDTRNSGNVISRSNSIRPHASQRNYPALIRRTSSSSLHLNDSISV